MTAKPRVLHWVVAHDKAYRYLDGQPDNPHPFAAAGCNVQVHDRDHHLLPGQH